MAASLFNLKANYKSYTERVADLATARVRGFPGSFEQTATGAAIIGLYSRVFSACSVEVQDTSFKGVFSPHFLAACGNSLARHGEAVWIIEVFDNVKVLPASTISISGGYNPESWRYNLTLPGPTQIFSRKNIPGNGLLHFKINVDHRRPWRGVSIFESADVSVQGLALMEDSLQAEYGMPVSRLFAYRDLGDDQAKDFATSFKSAKGVNAIGLGDKETYDLLDFRPEPNAETITSKDGDIGRLIAAAGIPPALLVAGANAQAMREAYRQFILVTVNPILSMMATELSEKFETEVNISSAPLHATNISERARAYKLLVDAGHDRTEAARIAGIS